jgi:hypothetical protein
MNKLTALMLILFAVTTTMWAGVVVGPVPEIDGGTASGAVALLGGAALFIWSRNKR